MDFSKIVGWLVFLAGIVIIGWTLLSSYNIFTAKTPVPEFFSLPQESLTQEQTGQSMEEQFQQMIGEQIKGLIPVDTLPQVLNLTIWSMLAFILVFGGSQIAGLGIKLIHPVK